MIRLSQKIQEEIIRVREADSDTFSDLVKVAGLDPASDFTHANLQGVDFTGSDLAVFNFEFADLRGAIWDSVTSAELPHYMYALRGRRRDPISATDFDAISERSLKSQTWGERFFAFALTVDNFGEVDLTFALLTKIMDGDNSVYMKHCTPLYFLASHLDNSKAMNYCIEMASLGNSYGNMYRLRKLKRLLNEHISYAISTDKIMECYPGRIPIDKIVSHPAFLRT